MPLCLDDRIRPGEEVLFQTIEGETVLLHLERGVYFGLDPVGTRVWEAVVQHGSARAALPRLLDEFDVSPDTLAADVLRLLEELLASELIVRA